VSISGFLVASSSQRDEGSKDAADPAGKPNRSVRLPATRLGDAA
jgi:hypothetical protein